MSDLDPGREELLRVRPGPGPGPSEDASAEGALPREVADQDPETPDRDPLLGRAPQKARELEVIEASEVRLEGLEEAEEDPREAQDSGKLSPYAASAPSVRFIRSM